jgi:hypothetical protein
MLQLPGSQMGGELLVALGQRAQLSEHVVLAAAGGFGNHRSGGEELARRILAPLDLEYPMDDPLTDHLEGDEDDHAARKGAAESEKVRTHA